MDFPSLPVIKHGDGTALCQTWMFQFPLTLPFIYFGDFPASQVAEKTPLRVTNDHRGILRPPNSETHGPTPRSSPRLLDREDVSTTAVQATCRGRRKALRDWDF